jgi:hypothetical protein
MTQKLAKAIPSCSLSRCLHRYPSGRRCRLPLDDSSSYFCHEHAHLQPPALGSGDLSPELVGKLTEFKSALDINRVLSNLLLLISRDRIAPRRASVVAYTCNLLLQSLVAIDFELHPPVGKDEEIVQIIVDTPRPNRDPRLLNAQASPNA